MWLCRSAFGNFWTIRGESANGLPGPTAYLGFGETLLRFINSRGRRRGDNLYFDVELATKRVSEVPSLARAADGIEVGAIWANEIRHDPFVQLALAAANSERVRVGTATALAFTRSPMTLAYAAWDIQNLSRGRLMLGLGSQVKGHIERRFGMKWEHPVARMREVIRALRSIWSAWQTGERLEFEGRFYKINLMTPFFNPGPIEHPKIPIFLAGVNPRMCVLAGEFCDGLHIHPLHTVRYVKERILSAVQEGLGKSGRTRGQLQLAASVFVATGKNQAELRRAREECRRQVAFYASTRTYRGVLELHGWGDACDRLYAKSVSGDWDRMSQEVSDEMLREFVLEGLWDELPGLLRDRYEGLLDRVRLYTPFDGSAGWAGLARAFRKGSAQT